MFGQPPKNADDQDKTNLESVLFAQELELETNEFKIANNDTEFTLPKSNNQPEVVNVVEKISNILSPYFIVLVGLFLYENNFFIGTLLIFVGIFSLLKLSWQDFNQAVTQIKNFFKSDAPIP